MKNLKYRSVISLIMVGMLSVFLFTGCEKDTGVNPANGSKKDIIEKFKRLKFQTVTVKKGKTSGSFAGTSGGGNTSFVPPDAGNSESFAANTGSNNLFTDPTSSGQTFGVNGAFGLGGGSFTLNGKKVDLSFGFCGFDIFGQFDNTFTSEELNDVNIFIGIAGDFAVGDTSSSSDSGINYVIYAASYNGGTTLTNLDDWSKGSNLNNLAFVIVIAYDNSNPNGIMTKTYLSTGGNITFSDSQLTLGGVTLVDSDGNTNGSLDASLECVNYNDL